MSVFDITLPKPSEDIWAVEVDFTDRLDIVGGEELSSVSCQAYKLWDYGQSVEEYDLEDVLRLNVTLEMTGNQTYSASYPITTQPAAELRFPVDYDAQVAPGICPPGSIVIGPDLSGEPANFAVSFHIQEGEDGVRYAILVTALTSEGRQHSCVLRFTVEELDLTG